MAGTAGGDLDGRDPLRADALGVVLGFQVASSDSDTELAPHGIDGGVHPTGACPAPAEDIV
jgi:hypothetical protein